jgi:hypothetical protein
MNPENPIRAELAAWGSPLAEMPGQLPYAAPVGYFDTLPEILLKRVQGTEEPAAELASISPLLAGLSRKMPYQLPEGYFHQVPEELQAGISALEQAKEALEDLHPILTAAKGLNPYRVPEQYFEEFPALMLEKTRTPATIIGINRSWVRYMAAAALTGLILLAGWLYTRQQTLPAIDGNQVAANTGLPADLKQAFNQISDEAIMNYADSTEILSIGSTASSTDELDPSDIHVLFEEVSDDALQQYLKEQPGKPLYAN